MLFTLEMASGALRKQSLSEVFKYEASIQNQNWRRWGILERNQGRRMASPR